MGSEIFLFATVQTDTDVRPHFCPKCSWGLFSVGTAAGVWYQPLTHIWYPRLENNRAVDCVWNVMAHMQKPDFVFRQNGRVHLNR